MSNSTNTPLRLGSKAPNFDAETTHGKVNFHEYLGDSWFDPGHITTQLTEVRGVIFSHPADFTPVCTTELGEMARLEPEFAKRFI